MTSRALTEKVIHMGQTDMTVAREILRQLGGQGQVGLLLGVTQFAGDSSSIRVKFRAKAKDGVNCFKVTLTPMDTYTVNFYKVARSTWEDVAEVDDVYCDNLVEVIEDRLGLLLHF